MQLYVTFIDPEPLDYLLGSQLEPGQNMLQWGMFWLNVMHLHP